MTKTYYGPAGDTSSGYRLSPAPQISISTEPYYSGDIIIGYTHNVSIRGYAAAYRKTGNTDASNSSVSSIGLVTDNIAIVQKILSRNGSTLSIREDDGKETIKCKGGTLRSLSFTESPNNWMGYSEYSATIEFNEVELINGSSLDTIACSDSYLDQSSKSNSMVDIDKYKIKSFTDSWSFGIDDNLYNRVIDTNYGVIDTENSSMTVTYSISATGKNYYVNDNLVPAWEQAKNFAQDRLYRKVSGMLSSTLGLTANTACAASSSLNGIGSATDGSLQNLNSAYGVYNETLSCTTSESDGTFSVTYNAIIKKNNNTDVNHPASKHTFSRATNVQNDTRKITTISVQGTIEGLLEGGIIRSAGTGFRLPQNGSILISSSSSTKYAQALIALNKIISGGDLTSSFKTKLGITPANLGITTQQLNNCGNTTLQTSSFSLTHNYHEGTINYSAEYSSNIVCGQSGSLVTMNISTEDAVPVLAEIPVPGLGSDVLVIQDMNTKTAKKININIEGKGSSRDCCLNANSIAGRIAGAGFSIPAGVTLPDMSLYILTQKQRTDNPIDGSYSISLGYMCASGCQV